MKIVRVDATALDVPLQVSLPGIERTSSLEACFVEIETDAGIVGHGLAGITRETVIAEIVNGVVAPAIKGDDPLANERIWDKLYWTLTPRGQTGFGAQALSAVDTALWDIKGKALGQPLWRLHRRCARAGASVCHLRVRLSSTASNWPPRRSCGCRRATAGSRWWSATRPCSGANGGRWRRSSGRMPRGWRRCGRPSAPMSSSTSTPIAASTSITPCGSPRWSRPAAFPSSRSRSRRTTRCRWRRCGVPPACRSPAGRTKG